MVVKPLSVDEYREMMVNGELADPLIFLEALTNGIDLRRKSSLAHTILEISTIEFPSKAEWDSIVEKARSFQFMPIEIAESLNAAKALAEYIHPKLSRNDIRSDAETVEHSPLTEEEIMLFKEKFNDEF